MGPRTTSAEPALAKRIRVLIIEDNRLVREGLVALLDAKPDLSVVGAAASPAAGLRHVQELAPDVVLVDAGLDNADSCRCVRQIRTVAPAAKVIVMDLLPVAEEVVEFVKAGANGFMMKDATVEDLVATVRSVAGGTDVIPAALTETLLSQIAHEAVLRRLPGAAEAVRMTKREREIVNLIAEGLGNKAIAQRLDISTYTVKSHVHNILEKLALHSRLEIAAYTYKGKGDPPRD